MDWAKSLMPFNNMCAERMRQAPHQIRIRQFQIKVFSGFTLVELMVSLAIVAVMMGLAVPSYRYAINSSRISSDSDNLLIALQLARTEAIRRGLSVSVCSSNANGSACSGSNNWKTGWLVFVDVNNNASYDGGDALVRQQPALASANAVSADNNTSAVRFNREGIASGLAADPVTVTFTPPTNSSTQKRCLAISAAGRMLIQRPGTGAC
jgi:type IV fimbrial biogenesis protein FimT